MKTRALVVALATLCASVFWHQDAFAGVTHIALADGTSLEGEIVEIQVGTRVRVLLDDGSVQDVAWTELTAVPPVSPIPVSEQPTGLVLVESTNRAMALSAPGVSTLCSTPCLLRMPVGPTQLYVGGYQRTGALVRLNVTDTPMRYVMHDAPRRMPHAVTGVFAFSLTLNVMAGASMLAGFYGLAAFAPQDQSSAVMMTTFGVLGMAAFTPFTVAIGIQFLRPATGVAHAEPLRSALQPLVVPTAGGAVMGVAGAF